MTSYLEFVPDDVWITIFEDLETSELAVIIRTCRRFRNLARKPLLKEIKWVKLQSTKRHLDFWKCTARRNRGLAGLVKKVVVEIGYDNPTTGDHAGLLRFERVHDLVFYQLPRFIFLHELVLRGDVVSPCLYMTLLKMPSLRSLVIEDCTYISILSPFMKQTPQTQLDAQWPQFDFFSLPLTHLSIHEITIPKGHYPHNETDEDGSGEEPKPNWHPLHLLTIPSLTSVSVTWSSSFADQYAYSGWWPFPKLSGLHIVVPVLTKRVVRSFRAFFRKLGNPLGMIIDLDIQSHDLTLAELGDMGTVGFQLNSIRRYTGPSDFLTFVNKDMIDGILEPLTHIILTSTVEVAIILPELARISSRLQVLHMSLSVWDTELLFAIRHLFPRIQDININGFNSFSNPGFLINLGADILFDLPNLRTLKLLPNYVSDYSKENNFHFDDLEGYILGWSRYCKQLRYVQFSRASWWSRRFESDGWKEYRD
ncbi:hypothetical protein CPB84DRAFT_1789264 [Gymnopilus junonius]|uniref:F-box domain-containing protein n=1 Tax=Gymnopilus junonius TaxID=109634 RepID=A0A9P5NDS6_GYMJU|nr:hypothetical protein CPB84DRAFT_1789264 [Gymnopilus junonius]